MRMLDPSSFRFTSEPNYLNHPSPYYVLLAHLGPNLEGYPGALIVYRLFNVALAAIGLAALMAIGLLARLSRFTLYAYVVPLACIPVLAPLAGSINNDNAAFAGGGIATLSAWQLMATGSRASLIATLGGIIVASWAKLTGLLLVGGLVSGVLAWLLWRGRLQPPMDRVDRDCRAAGDLALCRILRTIRQPGTEHTGTNRDVEDSRARRRLGWCRADVACRLRGAFCRGIRPWMAANSDVTQRAELRGISDPGRSGAVRLRRSCDVGSAHRARK